MGENFDVVRDRSRRTPGAADAMRGVGLAEYSLCQSGLGLVWASAGKAHFIEASSGCALRAVPAWWG